MHSTCIQRNYCPNFGGTSEVQSVHAVRIHMTVRDMIVSDSPLLLNPRIHRKASRCTNSRGTCSQACTSEGSIAEHCKLTYRSWHPCPTVGPGFLYPGPASAARARPITLRAIAIEAGSTSGRGQGSRLQASDGSQACSARSPGAAPPLTMLARRGAQLQLEP